MKSSNFLTCPPPTKTIKNLREYILMLTCGLFSMAVCNSCSKDHNNSPVNKTLGYLYTTTNGESVNNVVKFSRHEDGTLTDEKDYTTNSNGGADVSAGGDAHGDFDAQGAVQIIGNYLLNVNAGGNQVSVFSLDKSTGDLTFKSNTGSGGTRPVSIGYIQKSGSSSDYWVVVGNQWGNPNVQKDGAAIERYPNDAFHMQDLTLPDATDNERNIQLFTFNSVSGVLTSVAQLDHYVRENGGPTTVSFSADGTKLAVSTWGIAHCDTPSPSLDEQHPSRVYVYDFNNGTVSNRRYYEEIGIAGTIGFSWAKNSSTTMFVSNFNLIVPKMDNSITILNDNGSAVGKSGNFSATAALAINESCWTALNPAGDKLYVASFQTNLVSAFEVNGASLSFSGSIPRGGNAPHGDSKETWVSPDNKYVYNLGALQSFSINRFDISGNSLVYKTQTNLNVTAPSIGVKGKYNFLGLTGFDIQ